MYARTPSALPPYTAVTNGLAIRTPSAPSARALKTSVPLLMPPSTRILMSESLQEPLRCFQAPQQWQDTDPAHVHRDLIQ